MAAASSSVRLAGRVAKKSVLRPAHVLRIRPEAVSIEAEYRLAHFE